MHPDPTRPLTIDTATLPDPAPACPGPLAWPGAKVSVATPAWWIIPDREVPDLEKKVASLEFWLHRQRLEIGNLTIGKHAAEKAWRDENMQARGLENRVEELKATLAHREDVIACLKSEGATPPRVAPEGPAGEREQGESRESVARRYQNALNEQGEKLVEAHRRLKEMSSRERRLVEEARRFHCYMRSKGGPRGWTQETEVGLDRLGAALAAYDASPAEVKP